MYGVCCCFFFISSNRSHYFAAQLEKPKRRVQLLSMAVNRCSIVWPTFTSLCRSSVLYSSYTQVAYSHNAICYCYCYWSCCCRNWVRFSSMPDGFLRVLSEGECVLSLMHSSTKKCAYAVLLQCL